MYDSIIYFFGLESGSAKTYELRSIRSCSNNYDELCPISRYVTSSYAMMLSRFIEKES